MPTYDYACPKCGHRFELFHGIRDEAPKKCPKCKARAKRVPSAGGGLLFKGSGFYITDYRSDSYKKAQKSESGAKGESKAGDKGESKAGAKGDGKARSKGDGSGGSKGGGTGGGATGGASGPAA